MAQAPYLHDLAVVLRAPVQFWSRLDGQLDGSGMQGVFCSDYRVLSRALLSVDGHELVPTGRFEASSDSVRFDYVLRSATDGHDPALTLSRFREVSGAGVRETFRISSVLPTETRLVVRVGFGADATKLAVLRSGGAPVPVRPDRSTWNWRDDATRARLETPGASVSTDESGPSAVWDLTVRGRAVAECQWLLELEDAGAQITSAPESWSPSRRLETEAGTPVDSLVRRCLSDLASLRVVDSAGHVFLAAGAPWYCTLFGRDSLLSARFLLPIDPELAHGTLRALARHQGQRDDEETGEQPGKIPHEIRREQMQLSGELVLPPVYYGTIDATPLWISLLHDAWRAGLADDAVLALFDNLRRALHWLREHVAGDSFLEYPTDSLHGLRNQGWKDSSDSVLFGDGRLAGGPIAVVEVQGYAYAAARAGARLLAAFGATSTERAEALFWDRFAENLANRFRESFWVGEGAERYPALALDAEKAPVDSVTSNMGHLIGTGILDSDEERTVVERLLRSDMFSGYGVRTLSADHPAYWPLSYHNGSVWPHDNALILDNLRRSGFQSEARRLAEGQLSAAAGFAFQFPELFGGQDQAVHWPPHPYPSSCRPQAWAAAGAIPIARALGVALAD